MTIEELGDILSVKLLITRYANQDNRYSASFENTDTKESKSDKVLTGTYGDAKSPNGAIADYVEKIRGKFLVIDA